MRSRRLVLAAAVLLTASWVWGQGSPKVTGTEPAKAKVDSNLTVMGENLGKELVTSVFLSDDAMDYKATVVEQAATKIVMKIPQVKPGPYNVSVQVGNNILIQPIRITVE